MIRCKKKNPFLSFLGGEGIHLGSHFLLFVLLMLFLVTSRELHKISRWQIWRLSKQEHCLFPALALDQKFRQPNSSGPAAGCPLKANLWGRVERVGPSRSATGVPWYNLGKNEAEPPGNLTSYLLGHIRPQLALVKHMRILVVCACVCDLTKLKLHQKEERNGCKGGN